VPGARSLPQRGWDRFDRLGDIQTAVFLSIVLLCLAATAAALLLVSLPDLRHPTPAVVAMRPAIIARHTAEPTPAPLAAAAARPQLVKREVNLRAAAGTSAPVLATLPQATWVWLQGDSTLANDLAWQPVRTDDGREGWIIASALD
jgi:hypothetical protein